MVIFNGGNNNLYIQFNFIIISIFFLLFIREKNYLAHALVRDRKFQDGSLGLHIDL